MKEAIERLLTAYNLGCGMYLDAKLDRQRFQRQYQREIENVFIDDFYKEVLQNRAEYPALYEVHEMWIRTERQEVRFLTKT